MATLHLLDVAVLIFSHAEPLEKPTRLQFAIDPVVRADFSERMISWTGVRNDPSTDTFDRGPSNYVHAQHIPIP